jgi:DNA-binding transcriptional regulator YhcF (GntR family)
MSLTKTFVNDTTRYKPSNITPEPNTIYLMARSAGPGVDHLYYLYTNSKGEQFSLSGFPKNDRSQVPTATVDNFLNGGGGWGSIIRKAGSFSPGTPNYFYSTRLAVYRSLTNNPNEVARDWQLLIREYDKIQGAAIPYRLNGHNSNSAAITAERNWGNSTDITVINQQLNRTDINTPGSQYDQIIEWYPNTQKSDIKDSQKLDSSLNLSNNIQTDNAQINRAYQQLSKEVATVVNSRELNFPEKQNLTTKGTDSKAELSKVVALLKNNAAEVKKQSGFDVTTDDGLGRAVMQYWKENNLDPKTLKEQLPTIKDSKTANSVKNQNSIKSNTDVSNVVALLKENAAEVKKQYGLDVTTDEGLGKAVMQYWKENNLDPKTLKEQLPNIKDSEFDKASAVLANNNVAETAKTNQLTM